MKLALAVFGASLVLAGCATGPKEENHAAHHPPGAAAAATPGQTDSMMKSMQEHMKLMHDGKGCMGGAQAMGPERMGKRMDMTMDGEAMKPPAAK
jgi:hypothetical protein